ncbi:MAG: COX15/CtaA family protein [Methylophilaceae bacterium]|nr:COX15/CtaA family protein [Methylophilaceae bacterium]
MQKFHDRLALVAACLAFCVVVLGAYVRLSDAGLSCPDWPGCYGHLMVPHSEAAQAAFPDKPLDPHKAWKEMAHRYLAGTLGLLILVICITAWLGRGRLAGSPLLPSLLLVLVVFQAALGMWTVTLLLKPVIVTLHLLGGMATLGVLVWLVARCQPFELHPVSRSLRIGVPAGLLLLVCQIALGGWTSSNYAALACADFPTCQGQWWPEMDFVNGFHLVRELGVGADGSPLPLAALSAIHMVHRLGALVILLYLGWLASALLKVSGMRPWGWILLGLLLVQIGLGIGNVLLGLPLPLAVAHNAGAALLLSALVVIHSKIARGERS